MSEYMFEGVLRSPDEIGAIATYRGKRIAKLEAELQRVRMNSVRPAHRRANSEGENNE